jgi:hypothetical protein
MDYVATSKYKNQIVWVADLNPGTTQHTVASSWNRPIWVQTGDLDRDGDPDIVAASDTWGLAWWENTNGKGTGWTGHYITQQELYTAPSLHLVDLDNDGDLDLTAATEKQMVWWENLGAPKQKANWIRRVVDTNTYAYGSGYALFPADVNGDGQMDIVGCDRDLMASGSSQPGRRLGWWENKHLMPETDNGQIGWAIYDIDTTLKGAWGVDVADFNGDGWLDVAAAGYGAGGSTGETRWYRNTPGTPITWPKAFSTSFDKSRGVTAFSSARGQPHYLVSGNANTGEVREFYGNDWNWTSTSQSARLASLGNTYMSAVADLDDDGKLDIIGASTQNDDVVWRPGATGTQSKIEDNCDGARAVCAADIDRDGDLEVAAVCQNEHYLYWWWQGDYGDDRWSSKVRSPNMVSGATDIECGDINGDDRIEMVVARPGPPGEIAWTEYFSPTYITWDSVTTNFTGTEQIELADLDQDGDLDILATSNSLDKLAWFENKGGGSYTQHILDEEIGGVRDLVVGDISGDGALDIVIAAQNQNRVRWYEQQVSVDLWLEKYVDAAQCTGVISTGESIPYIIKVTNNTPIGTSADVLVVDTWEPSGSVVAASGEGCVANVAQDTMTCTLSLKAGQIVDLGVVLTPSLKFNGLITNTATVVAAPPFFNLSPSFETDSAVPVLVQLDPTKTDLSITPGLHPMDSLYPGGVFGYSVTIANLGPKASTQATMRNMWSPASAIAGLKVTGISMGGVSRSSLSAMDDYACAFDGNEGELTCDFDNLMADMPITVTVNVTTSRHFTDLLKAEFSLTGPDEGNPANNQTWPIWVGSRPFEKVYLPLIVRQSP